MKRIILFFIISLSVFSTIYSKTERKSNGILFSYSKNAETVSVAGEFNKWNKDINVMKKNNNGIFSVFIALSKGEYAYKFVINGSKWIKDETAEKFIDDGMGGKNSVVIVKELIAKNEKLSEKILDIHNIKPAGGIKITYRSPDAKKVSIVGNFNHWDKAVNPMKDPDKDGVWETVIYLENGEYPYMFVIDDIKWRSDSNAKKFKDDGFGGKNSVLVIK